MNLLKNCGLVVASAMVLALGGCSISVSSASISESIAASSASVSDSLSSSSPNDSSQSEQAYREDVRDYTVRRAKSGSGPDDFAMGLASVAEQHGVTNWQADNATYVGIGEGLARAGVDARGVARWTAVLQGEGASDDTSAVLIRQGYNENRS